ncbi:MAG: hypothetical protein V1718_06200, partial [archaeon]
PANPGSNLYNILKIALLLLLMWILGFGYILNIAVNSLAITEDHYACKKGTDCTEKDLCGLTTKCLGTDSEPICIFPESPLVEVVKTVFEEELREAGGKTADSDCTCTEKKCVYDVPEKNTTLNTTVTERK